MKAVAWRQNGGYCLTPSDNVEIWARKKLWKETLGMAVVE